MIHSESYKNAPRQKRGFETVVSRGLGAILALALALPAGLGLFAESAYGETYAGGVILKNETPIEKATNAFEEVQGELDAINAQLEELERQIPDQQERTNRAIVLRYKHQSDNFAILDVMFGSQSLDEFLKQAEYIQRVSDANLQEINRMKDLRAQQTELKSQVETVFADRQQNLTDLQQQRSRRQSADIARSQGQANMFGGEASVGLAADGGEQPEDYREAATQAIAPLTDGADWFASRDEFIAHWTERLDAYLAGSPLEGQGQNFAKAAWKHNIDPRWSAAISNTESSKALQCIRPHNAWGWGADDRDPYGLALEWDSWEEAIDAHAQGLSEGYGYTISIKGAMAYCPNTWQSWYNKTLAEMSRI